MLEEAVLLLELEPPSEVLGSQVERFGILASATFGSTLVTVAKVLANSWSAATWLSLVGESGEAGD
jgi:hypothetical protein